MIKKRSIVEVQKRNRQDAQLYDSSAANDRCFSEHKSSRRKKCAKSDKFMNSNLRMTEQESIEDQENFDEDYQSEQSGGQKSGSSHLRSAKSLRKKNIQMEKSAFSPKNVTQFSNVLA